LFSFFSKLHRFGGLNLSSFEAINFLNLSQSSTSLGERCLATARACAWSFILQQHREHIQEIDRDPRILFLKNQETGHNFQAYNKDLLDGKGTARLLGFPCHSVASVGFWL
jgi:hypothetical protein